MKQQPLEEKIFSYQSMNKREKKRLEKELVGDPEMRSLLESWQLVQSELVDAELLSPRDGFKLRWVDRYEADLQRKEKLQTGLLSLLSSGVAIALLVALIQRLLEGFEALDRLFVSGLNAFVEFAGFLQILFGVSASMLQKIPSSLWLSISALVFLLPLLWVAVFREFALKKGVYR